MPLGTIIGAAALMGGAPAVRTIRVSRDAFVLRMAANRFGRLIAEYPPVLAYLSDLASTNDPP